MLQPHSEMPEVAMGVNGRRMMSSSRRDDNEADNEKENRSIFHSILKFVRFLVPHIALLSVFFLYLVFGAYIFTILEGPTSEASSYKSDMDDVKTEMFMMITNMSSGGRAPQDALASESMDVHANEDGGDSSTDSAVIEVDRDEIEEKIEAMMERMMRPEWKIARMESMQVGRAWSMSSGMLFCMTTITTIGYGDIVPITGWGRTFCLVYSIIGIPLALICLANIGNLLARMTLYICRLTHYRIILRNRIRTSCRSCRKTYRTNHRSNSSQRKIVNNDVEISLDNIDKPPEYTSQENVNKYEVNNGMDSIAVDPPFMRSVSIATETPTSHPRGVTKQLPTLAESEAHEKACACKHECDCAHKDDLLEEVPLTVVVLILITYICAGAAIMASSEGWSYGTGVYFMFITLTTIGFGDVLPINHYAADSFLPCIFFTVFGLAIMSMCIALVQVKLIRGFELLKVKTGLC